MPRTTPRQRDRMAANRGARRSRSNTAPSPSSSIQSFHHHVHLSNDHLYGMIMWLPPEDEIILINQPPYPQTTGALCGLETGCYDHPVLVLSPVFKSLAAVNNSAHPDNHPSQKVTILMITSFGGRDIRERFPSPSNVKQRIGYLPISPADQHPDLPHIPVLTLAGGLEMAKGSYVDIIQKHEVPRQVLRQYRMKGNSRGGVDDDFSGLRHLLTRKSYLIVTQEAGYSIPTFPVPVSIPVALPSPSPSPAAPRNTRRQCSPPPTTAAQRLGITAAQIPPNPPSTHTQPPSTLFQNFQAERVRPDALNPGRGTRVSAARAEVTPLLPVYQTGNRAGRRPGSPHRASRAGYYAVGGAPSHSETREVLIALCVMLALLAGAGYGVWAAWVYRAAIGRGLLVPGRWIVENGWELVKTVLKFGWKVLSLVAKWVGGVVKGAAGWAWEKLKGLLG